MAEAREGAGLPAFIIIGATKSGTSSLRHYLRQHPEICMSSAKEPNFFIERATSAKAWTGIVPFLQITRRSAARPRPLTARGTAPGRAGTAPSARSACQADYILRDPIDRMFSHYLHNRIFGPETRSFSEAVADRSYRKNYVRTSMYRFQLAAFLEHLPLERVLLVTTEDLKDARGETLRRTFRFIGVDPHFEGSDFDPLFNQTQVTGGAAPSGAHRGAIGVLRAGHGPDALERPAFAQEDQDRLTEYLAPDIDGLRALTGLRFERWRL